MRATKAGLECRSPDPPNKAGMTVWSGKRDRQIPGQPAWPTGEAPGSKPKVKIDQRRYLTLTSSLHIHPHLYTHRHTLTGNYILETHTHTHTYTHARMQSGRTGLECSPSYSFWLSISLVSSNHKSSMT